MKLKCIYPPRRHDGYLPVVVGEESYPVAEDGTLDVPAGTASDTLLATGNFEIAETVEIAGESQGDESIQLKRGRKKGV